MKVNELLLLRRKYVDLIFELCGKNQEILPRLKPQQDILAELMKKDLSYHAQATKITHKIESINKHIKDLSTFMQGDLPANAEISDIQNYLKTQQKKNKIQRQESYTVISSQYNEIIEESCSLICIELQKNELFVKMRLAVVKTEKKFIEYCRQWKTPQVKQYKELGQQIQLIIDFSRNLLQEINIAQQEEDEQLPENHLSALKNSKLMVNCSTLAHYIENFKKLYPQTLGFKDKSLTKINLRENFQDFMQTKSFGVFKSNLKIKEKLPHIKEQVGHVHELFMALLEVNNQHFEKLCQQKQRFERIALKEPELTRISIKQWLESDKKNIFSTLNSYLEKHKLHDGSST